MVEEFEVSLSPDFENGRFVLGDDDSPTAISSATIVKIRAAIEQNPGITQQELLKQAKMPETNGRIILHQADGTHWFSKQGRGTTLHYFLTRQA